MGMSGGYLFSVTHSVLTDSKDSNLSTYYGASQETGIWKISSPAWETQKVALLSSEHLLLLIPLSTSMRKKKSLSILIFIYSHPY